MKTISKELTVDATDMDNPKAVYRIKLFGHTVFKAKRSVLIDKIAGVAVFDRKYPNTTVSITVRTTVELEAM